MRRTARPTGADTFTPDAHAGRTTAVALDAAAGQQWTPIIDGYLRDLAVLLERLDRSRIRATVEHLRTARDAGRTLFVAGNGGSAATATHLANDLGKATRTSGQRPIRVLSLSDNVSWFSALANDEGYERVFVGQLENFAEPGDVLIVISASGNSRNLVEAVRHARRTGMWVVGLLGFDGGVLRELVDDLLWVKTEPGLYGLVESAHVVIADLLTSCLIQDVRGAGE